MIEKIEAGAFIGSGEWVFLGNDGKVYPMQRTLDEEVQRLHEEELYRKMREYVKPLDHNEIAAICRDVAARNGVDPENLDSLIFDFAKRWGRITDVPTIEYHFMSRLKESNLVKNGVH